MTIESPTRKDIQRILGKIDDHRVTEIIDLDPSLEELEVAMAYLADMTDVMGEERQPLSGIAAEIYEIVIRGEPSGEEEFGQR